MISILVWFQNSPIFPFWSAFLCIFGFFFLFFDAQKGRFFRQSRMRLLFFDAKLFFWYFRSFNFLKIILKTRLRLIFRHHQLNFLVYFLKVFSFYIFTSIYENCSRSESAKKSSNHSIWKIFTFRDVKGNFGNQKCVYEKRLPRAERPGSFYHHIPPVSKELAEEFQNSGTEKKIQIFFLSSWKLVNFAQMQFKLAHLFWPFVAGWVTFALLAFSGTWFRSRFLIKLEKRSELEKKVLFLVCAWPICEYFSQIDNQIAPLV